MLDVGFHLDYCGDQVLTNVQKMICADAGEMLFRCNGNGEIYLLPTKAVKFIIPHVEEWHNIEDFVNGVDDADWSD